MPHLLLNLGHNSAAVSIDVDGNAIGYEEERLNRIKSSSAFPRLALERLLNTGDLKNYDENLVFVSHWFDDFNFNTKEAEKVKKYFDFDYIKGLRSRGYSVITLNPTLTHHDAHAWSAVSFFENHYEIGPWRLRSTEPFSAHIIVADGFGNRQEVLSIYLVKWSMDGETATLAMIGRLRGYKMSLGMMYQYATSFTGMRENQDEYKFLGYESHIDEIKCNRDVIEEIAEVFSNTFMMGLKQHDGITTTSPSADFINTEELGAAKRHFYEIFEKVVQASGVERGVFNERVCIGYFIQCVLENFYTVLIDEYKMENVLMAGGVHYNVKLNNHVAKQVPGVVSIVPLAGDQGTGIGLYRGTGHKFPFKGLLWGKRDLTYADSGLQRVHYFTNCQTYVDFVAKRVLAGDIVNTITGAMEFGPRALCNTSTLALPHHSHVESINALNGRDTVMPFAGVMLDRKVGYFHSREDRAKVIGSLEYMVTTLDYRQHNPQNSPLFAGIMHKHPTQKLWTGRPQIITDQSKAPIKLILEEIEKQCGAGAIINTSLNVHGKPIVYSIKDALDDFQVNLEEAAKLNLTPPILAIGHF